MYRVKIRFLLLLLFFPVICHAEEADAPPKFYDDLPIAAPKTPKYYIVKANESLAGIAARYGYNYLKLARWNDIPAPYHVVAGQRLKLFNEKTEHHKNSAIPDNSDDAELLDQEPEQAIATTEYKKSAVKKSSRDPKPTLDQKSSAATESYVVGKNESLSRIALRFNVAVGQLMAWNDITAPNQVYAGQKLKIFKNKQKHSLLKSSKKQPKIAENVRDDAQKTSIISINNKSMLKFYYHWPTTGKVVKNFAQTGGRGIEIKGKAGQAIKATAAGKVVAVSPGIFGHGGFIVIQHHDQFLSSYANNRRSLVKNGQIVAQGQIIAEMGRVGRKPPSLEFEIRNNGKLVDPLRFLPKKI